MRVRWGTDHSLVMVIEYEEVAISRTGVEGVGAEGQGGIRVKLGTRSVPNQPDLVPVPTSV